VQLDRRGSDTEALARARQAFERINGVLDILPDREIHDQALISWVEERLAARRAARERRDFGEADRIRAELVGKGIAIEDAGGRTTWKRVR
jgi:cysteinyl-tRNA synthetase